MSIVRVVFWLRLVTLIGLCLPALDLAWRWYSDDLGARPVTEATHITGDWAVVFLLCSLALTPARSVYDWMPLVQIRRRVGVAAALYAGLHFFIYVARPEMGPGRGRAGDREALLPHDRLRGAAGAGGARHHLDQRLAATAAAQLEAPALAGLSGRRAGHPPFLHPVQGQCRRGDGGGRPVRLADDLALDCRRRCARAGSACCCWRSARLWPPWPSRSRGTGW